MATLRPWFQILKRFHAVGLVLGALTISVSSGGVDRHLAPAAPRLDGRSWLSRRAHARDDTIEAGGEGAALYRVLRAAADPAGDTHDLLANQSVLSSDWYLCDLRASLPPLEERYVETFAEFAESSASTAGRRSLTMRAPRPSEAGGAWAEAAWAAAVGTMAVGEVREVLVLSELAAALVSIERTCGSHPSLTYSLALARLLRSLPIQRDNAAATGL
eukprot:SAG11_NODE_296_length_11092_cov_24.402620_2_plen_217_part_00